MDGKYMSLFDSFNSKNEKHIDYVHNFLNVFKINDYENAIYLIIPKEDFHSLCLFKY